MAIENFEGCSEMLCDYCGEPYSDPVRDSRFHGMIQDAKEDGWRIRKNTSGWEHTCPSCLEIEKMEGF